MALRLPNDIVPQTTADALQIENNNTVLEDYVNREVITRDGLVTMQAPLNLYASPTQDQHAATKLYVDSVIPPGVVMPYGGITAPAGESTPGVSAWLLCNGGSYSVTTYKKLFDVIQYRFGGTGGTFKVPNIINRVMVGHDMRAAGTARTEFDTVGEVGGTWTAPIPLHHHNMTHDHGEFDSGAQSANHVHAMTHNHGSVNTKTGDGAHNHSGQFSADLDLSVTGGWAARRPTDTGTTDTQLTISGGGDHIHAVDLPQFTGDTGIQKTSHTHKVNPPKFTGDTADTGTAAVEHLIPYIVMSYIIRAS